MRGDNASFIHIHSFYKKFKLNSQQRSFVHCVILIANWFDFLMEWLKAPGHMRYYSNAWLQLKQRAICCIVLSRTLKEPDTCRLTGKKIVFLYLRSSVSTQTSQSLETHILVTSTNINTQIILRYILLYWMPIFQTQINLT